MKKKFDAGTENNEKPQLGLGEIKEILADHLKGNTLEFVMTQIKMASKSKHALRWSCGEKSLALSFFHSSPKTYRLLQKLFKLPIIPTLRRSMAQLDLKPGFPSSILDALRVKVRSMSADESLHSHF